MDRFIVQNRNQSMFCIIALKSNMDRFIVQLNDDSIACYGALKSNMDRFIDLKKILPAQGKRL